MMLGHFNPEALLLPCYALGSSTGDGSSPFRRTRNVGQLFLGMDRQSIA